MKIMPEINTKNIGRPELPTINSTVTESHNPYVTVDNTSGTEVLGLSHEDRILSEEEWNDLFGNSREFLSFDIFLNGEEKEMEAEKNGKNNWIRWTNY